MSLFWVQKLSAENPLAVLEDSSFADLVGEIEAAIDSLSVDENLREQCKAAWAEALQLDEIRELLAGAATKPEGLACFDQRSDGKEPLVADLIKLNDLNEKCVDLAKRLINTLDELYASLCHDTTSPSTG